MNLGFIWKIIASEMGILKICLGIFMFIGIVSGLKIVPERIKTVFVDHVYLEYFKFYVVRYGRKSAYYMNLESKNYDPWANNITIHLIFNEYLHNEYRRTFVEMHFKLCDFLNEPFVGGMFKNVGLKCPIPAGEYHHMNMTVPTEHFPYVMPFQKFRVDIFINKTEDNSMMYNAQLFCNCKK